MDGIVKWSFLSERNIICQRLGFKKFRGSEFPRYTIRTTRRTETVRRHLNHAETHGKSHGGLYQYGFTLTVKYQKELTEFHELEFFAPLRKGSKTELPLTMCKFNELDLDRFPEGNVPHVPGGTSQDCIDCIKSTACYGVGVVPRIPPRRATTTYSAITSKNQRLGLV